MKLSKFTVIMAVLLMAILAIGAVSAESIGDTDVSIATGDGDLDLQVSDDSAKDLSAVDEVSTDDAVDNLGSAVLTDEGDDDPDDGGDDIEPGDDGGYAHTYEIDDDTYSTYFNDDGTPTDAISADGNYEIKISLLNGKDITINSGSNICISPSYIEKYDPDEDDWIEYGGDIFDGTITIGANVNSIVIRGLTFHNTNKNAINVYGDCEGVNINNNVMFLETSGSSSFAAINIYGAVSNMVIEDNGIFMQGAAAYNYGINLMCYGALTNPQNIEIIGNRIEMEGTGETGMVEAMYISDPVGLLVEENEVFVNTINEVFAYGIQVADDVQYLYMNASYTGSMTSPRDIVINNNLFSVSSEYMTYAVSVLNYGVDGFDPEWAEDDIAFPHYFAFDTLTSITNNHVIAKSTRGVMAIAGQTYNMTVKDNDVIVTGGSTEGIHTDDSLGAGAYALCVEYDGGTDGDYTIVVSDNTLVSNVTAEYASGDGSSDHVTFENNTAASDFIVNDETYSVFFNEDGTPTSLLPELGDYTLVIEYLTDKNIIIPSGSNINITGKEREEDGEIFPGYIDGTITIGDYAGSAGSIIISNLEINAFNAAAITITDFTTDVTIENCRISAIGNPEESDNPYLSVYGISANGFISGLYILNNGFRIHGDAPYSYGIQLGSYGAYANPEDIVIAGNEIDVIVGDSMAEAIYLDNPVSAIIEDNTVTVSNTGEKCAYGIQIADSALWTYSDASYEGTLTSAHDILIQNNDFVIISDFMVYGITVLDYGVSGFDPAQAVYGGGPLCYQFDLNTTIVDNTVTANSKKGVLGIGGLTYNMTVMNNEVTAIGTSAEDMVTGDALGNLTAALGVLYNAEYPESYDGEVYYVIVKDNKVTTNVEAEYIDNETNLQYVTFENNTEKPIFVIDDESYSTYFNDDGTPKDTLPEDGGYVLFIDQIHNKDIRLNSGNEITIDALTDYRDAREEGEEDAANIFDGTIYINGATGVNIDSLTIVNENCNGIDIADGSESIILTGNVIVIDTVADETNPYFSVYGINANGYICDLTIRDNYIKVSGEAPYNYGIQLGSYGAEANPNGIYIIDNCINIWVSGENALMGEAIYLDSPVNAVIDGNEIYVDTLGDVFAYGIQVADSAQYVYYDAGYEGTITSPANITITNNEVTIYCDYMIYGITFQSFGANGYDEDMAPFFMPLCYQFELNTTIANNTVHADSSRGVIGIGALAYNVTIEDNTVYAYGTTAEDISSADALGNDTYAIGVNFNAALAEDDYYSNVINNYIRTDVTAKHINSEDYLDYVTFEDNTIIKVKDDAYIIDEETYDSFFDEDGRIKEELPVDYFYDVLVGDLNNKKLIFDLPVSINALDEESKLVNSTISLVEGADGSIIDGLSFEYEANAASTAIIYLTNVNDVIISNNNIVAKDCAAMMMAIEVESGSEGCNDILIKQNEITINGTTNYLYGIDVFQTWGADARNTEIGITENKVYIEGGAKMAEPIYVSAADGVGISDNELVSVSPGCAYGIATDSLTNAQIIENTLDVLATTNGMAYGITSTNSEDIEINDNVINAEGTGVVAIGLKDDEFVTIDGNSGTLTGAYYENAQTRDSIGKANAAILNKDDSSTDVTIGENNFIENFPSEFLLIDDENYDQYFDENGNIKEGTIADNAYILLGNMIGKNMVIDIPVFITKQEGTQLVNSTINLVEGADGTTVEGLTILFDNNTASTGIIYVTNVDDVTITKNTIVASDCKAMMMAIEVESGSEGCNAITISENTIAVAGTTNYLYGIDVFQTWQSEAKNTNIEIVDNTVTILGGGKMAEPIYVSAADDVTITGNEVTSITNASAYGIATDSLNSAEITDNTINAESVGNGMVYALTSTNSNGVEITSNEITAKGTGAVGIGLNADDDISIDDNTINVEGGDFTTAETRDSLGKANAAILNKGSTNVDIGENMITLTGPKFIDDSTYSQYFYENGTIKDDSNIVDGDTLFIGNLTNKKLTISDVRVDIKGTEDNKVVNTTINLLAGADGSTIDGLNMEFTGDNTTGSIGLIYAKDVSDIAITNNNIVVPDFVDKAGSKYGSSVYAIEIESGSGGCSFVEISGNNIDITGTARYLYGIDVFKTWGEDNERNSMISITDNNVTINGGSRMAEAIYVSESDSVQINNNTISSTAPGAAYGIATDQLDGAEIKENSIEATSEGNMAYGITATTVGSDIAIEGNNVTATGVGAVGVGISGQDNVTVNGNKIDIVGGDFTTITTADNLDTANAAILVKDGSGNENIVIGENALTENGKATDRVMTGNGTKDLQNILDAAEAGSTVDLTGQYFKNVGTVVLDKDIAITGGKIIGAEGQTIFEIAPKSQDGPSEVNITGVDFVVNNANTIVKVTAENATDPTSIEVPAISIKDNTIEAANDDVVTESVTVLELDSERPILSPTNDIAISGNTLAAGVDPFDFKVTSISSGGDTIIVPQNISLEKKATVIEYSDMNTTAVDLDTDGRVGEYFRVVLKDADGNALAGKAVQIGFNGKIYNRTTESDGSCKLQINLVRSDIYTFAVSFLGDDEYNGTFVVAKITVNAQKGTLTVPNKSYAASAKTKSLTATFKSASGKVVAGKKVTFTVNGKTYSATTDSKGVATVKVSLNTKGTYSFTAKYAGDGTYAAISKSAKLTIK